MPGNNDHRLVRKYVTSGRRYLKLMSAEFLLMPRWQQSWFQRRLRHDAARIDDRELRILLEGGWREQLTAAWLAGVDRRVGLRDRIGELLMDPESTSIDDGYCFALARFGSHADADLLEAYLDLAAALADREFHTGAATGALLHLDATLGTTRARRFGAMDGSASWEIDQFCILAEGGTPTRPPN